MPQQAARLRVAIACATRQQRAAQWPVLPVDVWLYVAGFVFLPAHPEADWDSQEDDGEDGEEEEEEEEQQHGYPFNDYYDEVYDPWGSYNNECYLCGDTLSYECQSGNLCDGCCDHKCVRPINWHASS